MRKNVASQIVCGQLNSKTDGTAVTSGTTTVYVLGDGGTQAAGSVGSGACTHEGNGLWSYAPAQAETNYDNVCFTFTNTSAVAATVQIYPSFPQTGDTFARLGAPAGASVSADVAAVKVDTAAVKVKTDFLPSATAGAAGGVFIAGTNAATAITTALTANITGNLSGSVGSVTGAAGSVTGAVGSVTGSVGSVTGAVGSVTGNVGGNVVGSVASVTARVTANTDQLAGQTVTAAVGVTFPASVASPTNLTAGTITTVSGNVAGSVGSVTGAVGSVTGAVGSVTGLTASNLDATVSSRLASASYTAPDNVTIAAIAGYVDTEVAAIKAKTDLIPASPAAVGDVPTVAAVADAVWDEVLSGHLTAGTTGNALNAAGAAGDPWTTALPGVYGAGTAGKIIGDNVNATISSRSTFAGGAVASVTGTVGGIAGTTQTLDALQTAQNSAHGAGSWATAIGFSTHSAADVWASGTRTLTSLGTVVADTATAVWAAVTRTLTAGTNIALAKGIGVTGFNDLDASGVRTAVGLGSANLDTQLDALPTNAELATALGTADDATLAQIALVKAKTDLIPASPAAVGDIPSAATNAAAVWAYVTEGTTTAVQMMRGFAATLLGKASGLATTTAIYRDIGDTKARVTATVDADGNRTAVTRDLT